ncbi:MAG: efflux RND transporter permease subunit, partial [Gemmataceae bacterium]
ILVETVLTAPGRLPPPEQVGNIIVKRGDGKQRVDAPLVRLRDVAQVELAAQQYGLSSSLDGVPSVSLAIFQVPDTNALQTAEGIQAKMAELSKDFPEGLEFRIVYDTTPFIRDSMDEVVKTLVIAVVLVAVVVLAFLQNWRAALIPLIAVPVAIAGTFAPMLVLGFNINTLSLFGLILAIGIVVDDAIVVVENVERWIEHGLPPRAAAHRAMDEVTGPIIGVALVLSAVFIPCAFFAGVVGQFFKQFALTIAISTVISAFNSLTLSPALAALLLRPKDGSQRDPLTRVLDFTLGGPFRYFNLGLEKGTAAYTRWVDGLLGRRVLGLAVYAVLVFLAGYGFTHWRKGFVPEQDQGYLVVDVRLPDGASQQWTQEVMARLGRIARSTPGVAHTVGVAGHSLVYNASTPSWGSMFVILAPFDERTSSNLGAPAILAELQKRCDDEVQDALVAIYPAPPIRGLATGGGFKLYVEDRGSLGAKALAADTDELASYARERLPRINTVFNVESPQIFVDVDRAKVRSLGVSLKDVFDTMQTYMGGRYVNSFNLFGRTWQVNAMAAPEFRSRVDKLLNLKVRNNRDEMVPLASLVTLRNSSGPNVVMRYNVYEAAPIITVPSPEISSAEVMKVFADGAARDLDRDMNDEWTEIMYLQILAGNTGPLLFALGVVLVFLVLAALYESWSLPLVVLLVVPLGLLSALAGLILSETAMDILAMIGLVVLVGLASKNAILIVEFARRECDEGKPARAATLEACKLRLRPILMTSFAFILGVAPLVVATGAGAELRRSLGVVVFSGMLGVTLFGIIMTPLFFYVSRTLGETFPRTRLFGERARRVIVLAASFLLFGFLGAGWAHTHFAATLGKHEGWLLQELREKFAGLPYVGNFFNELLLRLPPPYELIAFGICGAAGTVLMSLCLALGPYIHARAGNGAALPAPPTTQDEEHS